MSYNAAENEVTPIIIPGYQDSIEKPKKDYVLKEKLKNLWKNTIKTKNKKAKKEKVLSQTPSLLPFLALEKDWIVLKDGVMDILQISGRDLYALSDEERQLMVGARAGMYKSFFPSVKEVSLNFPTNMFKQKRYWLKKQAITNDPIRLRFIQRKLFELDFLEKERTNREFLLFIFAENESQLRERRQQLMKSGYRSFPLKILSNEKKTDILYLLNNQNTKL